MTVKNSLNLPFAYAACCNVIQQVCGFKRRNKGAPQPKAANEIDPSLQGIYLFGGKNEDGYLPNRLVFMKPVNSLYNQSLVALECKVVKQRGIPPCPRTGHQFTYLPLNKSLLLVGGRNDMECKSLNSPFLDDIHMFLLDQKSWIRVKYTPWSSRIPRMSEHCCATMSDA